MIYAYKTQASEPGGLGVLQHPHISRNKVRCIIRPSTQLQKLAGAMSIAPPFFNVFLHLCKSSIEQCIVINILCLSQLGNNVTHMNVSIYVVQNSSILVQNCPFWFFLCLFQHLEISLSSAFNCSCLRQFCQFYRRSLMQQIGAAISNRGHS